MRNTWKVGVVVGSIWAALSVVPVSAGEPGGATVPSWVQFASYEEKALRDYRWVTTTSDVIDNGRQLGALAKSDAFARQYRQCGLAARTLSYMVSGHYFSARRLAVSGDWHAMSGDYARYRSACLVELKLDERDYPLPGWFGR